MESTLHNPATPAALTTPASRVRSRSRYIVYWITTILIAMPIGSGGVAQVGQYLANRHGIVPVLGYPLYFFAILGCWKVLGAIAIVVPRFPLLKEWAYAGIFFDLTGAAASCAAVGGYGAYGFHVLASTHHGRSHRGIVGAASRQPQAVRCLNESSRRTLHAYAGCIQNRRVTWSDR